MIDGIDRGARASDMSRVEKPANCADSDARLTENFRAADLANRIVGKLFPLGAGNQRDHLFASAGESYWRAVKSYQIGGGKIGRSSSSVVRQAAVYRSAERAIAFQGGNCDHFASVAFVVLASLATLLTPDWNDPERQEVLRDLGLDRLLSGDEAIPAVQGRIHLVGDNQLHHRYVVLGEEAFDRDNVVVDAWVLNPKPHRVRDGAFEPRQLVASHDPLIDDPLIDVFQVRDLQRRGERHLEVGDRDRNEQIGDRLGHGVVVEGNEMRVWNQRSSRKATVQSLA